MAGRPLQCVAIAARSAVSAVPKILTTTAAVFALAACGTVADQTPASQTSTEIMAGRWVLDEPNAPSCGINFAGDAGVRQGSLTPDGGCPERFYLSRAWAFDGAVLTIKDENGDALGQFTFTNGRFEGQSANGTSASLSRQVNP
jgi:hypothetical protein